MLRPHVTIKEDKYIPENQSVIKHLKQWVDLINNSKHTDYRQAEPEELPEDIRPFVLQIRKELQSRGIDPSTVYPVDFETGVSLDEHQLVITIKYDYFKEGDK